MRSSIVVDGKASSRTFCSRVLTSSARASSGLTGMVPPVWSFRVVEQGPEGSQIEVEVGRGEAVPGLQLVHRLLQAQQSEAEGLDLLLGEIALVDAAQRLRLHQLADELDDREHELEQLPGHGGGIGVDPLAQPCSAVACHGLLR